MLLTMPIDGADNTAVGREALYRNVSGNYNYSHGILCSLQETSIEETQRLDMRPLLQTKKWILYK